MKGQITLVISVIYYRYAYLKKYSILYFSKYIYFSKYMSINYVIIIQHKLDEFGR